MVIGDSLLERCGRRRVPGRTAHPSWRERRLDDEGETLIGAPIDGERQELRNDVKGSRKHRYRMERNGAMWKVTVVVDV